MAPEVPELPGVILNEVSSLEGAQIDEALLTRVSEGIVQRVSTAGFPDQATALLWRMGRAMYELLLLIATEEELRAAGLLLEATVQPVVVTAPAARSTSARAPATSAVRTLAVAPAAIAPVRPQPVPSALPDPERPPVTGDVKPDVEAGRSTFSTAVSNQSSLGVRARPKDVPAAPSGPAPEDVKAPEGSGQTGSATQAPVAPAVVSAPIAAHPQAPVNPPQAATVSPIATVPPETAPTRPSAGGPGEVAKRPEAPAASANGNPESGVETPTIQTKQIPTEESPPEMTPPPSAPVLKRPELVASDEATLWGFDPAAREEPEAKAPMAESPEAVDGPQPDSKVLVVESAVPAGGRERMGPERSDSRGASTQAPGGGWTIRLSPKMSRERERRLEVRLDELPSLIDEIVAQVHEQRRAVSDRGLANKAVRAAAEQSAPSDMNSAETLLWGMLDAGHLTEASALVLRASEAFPGDRSADLACRVGEAARAAKEEPLAILCLTTAVIAAPPCETACWQLAGLAREGRDPRLAPIWMEFLARLLRVRGADEDAVVAYRQLLNLTPRRQDIRDILRVASLTGVLPD
jgi:hypothetical protein